MSYNKTNWTEETLITAPLLNKIENGIEGNDTNLSEHIGEGGADDVHGLLSGGRIIQSSDANVNGAYIRFSNGTQICYVNGISVTGSGDSTNASTSWTYPIGFLASPVVSVSTTRRMVGGSGVSTIIFVAHAVDVGSSAINTLRFVSTQTIETNEQLFADIIAIGRWK